MIKVKKIRNIIVGGTLATMLGASGLTAVFASNSKTNFTVSTYGYYGEDYDYTDFAEKSTTKSIALVVDSGSGSMDYQAMGANNSSGAGRSDCSGGYTYRIDGDGVASVRNFVVEWGYDYAGLRANCVGDDLTEQTGYFRAY